MDRLDRSSISLGPAAKEALAATDGTWVEASVLMVECPNVPSMVASQALVTMAAMALDAPSSGSSQARSWTELAPCSHEPWG